MLVISEENYNKILKENENIKKELDHLLTNTSNKQSHHHIINIQEITGQIKNKKGKTSSSTSLNSLENFIQIDPQRINIEYLKNILLKYLEAIAIGNEFQIKILENVIFTILNIPNSEKQRLEEKRARSSFYLNLWYNAKAFLAEKIYGAEKTAVLDNQNETESKINNGKNTLPVTYTITNLKQKAVSEELKSGNGNRLTLEEIDIETDNDKIQKNNKQLINEV